MERYTIANFNADYPDEDACLDAIRDLIYPDGIACRKCQAIRLHHRISGRKAYECDYCRTHVYPLAGTIFEKSSTPLKSWFYAMYLMAQTRCGISAKQLERELGVTYKTAWRMFTQIRKLLDESTSARLRGVVEIDEAAVGGKQRRGLRGETKRAGNKSTVVGMVERGGKVAALVTKDRTAGTILPLIHEHVLPATMIYTDDWGGYSRLSGNPRGYGHKRINHSQKVYVMGDVHTNTIEGFWFLLKTGILGTHHSVSAKHLQGYVDSYAFRYNHRDDSEPMYKTVSERVQKVRAGKYGAYAPIG